MFFKGFTLAELLICLAILGEIATFSIPKILSAQQNARNNAKAKEVAAMISEAFQQAQLDGTLNANTKPSDLTPYMSYVAIDTSSPMDAPGNFPVIVDSCTTYAGSFPCIKLHNGGLLMFDNACALNGSTSSHFMQFRFDPDGKRLGTPGVDGPSSSIWFDIYYNGRLTTRALLNAGSTCTSGTWGNYPGVDPSWFSW